MPSDKDDKPGVPAPVDDAAENKTAAPVAAQPRSDEHPVETIPEAKDSASIDVIGLGSPPGAGESGSIDVAMSGPLPKPPVLPDGAVVEPAGASDSAPVSSGRVTSMHAAATGPTESPRRHKITDAGKDMLGKGVSTLGSGIESIGEGVSKLGEASKKVPIVGPNIAKLGEGVTKLGESITELPRVARTRRGALLIRSLLVGFILVFSWIAIIVILQVQGTDSPDFRPFAERILRQITHNQPAISTLETRLLSKTLGDQEKAGLQRRLDELRQERVRDIEDLWEKASPRFQEMVRKERFVDEMLDLNKTAGQFLEVTAVNESFVSSGPTGRIGRMSMMVQYAKGKTRAAVSLHWYEGEWKLLGVSVEVPPEVVITKEQRESRVSPCEDVPNKTMNTKDCDVHVVGNRILEQLRDGHAAEVWDAANRDVFQKQEAKKRFIEITAEQQRVLGEYRRIIAVTEAKMFSSKEEERAYFDVIAEYSLASVRVIFGFTRPSKALEWQLRSLKIALPMPRIDDLSRTAGSGSAPPGPPQHPKAPGNSTGSGSATTGSGSSKTGSGS